MSERAPMLLRLLLVLTLAGAPVVPRECACAECQARRAAQAARDGAPPADHPDSGHDHHDHCPAAHDHDEVPAIPSPPAPGDPDPGAALGLPGGGAPAPAPRVELPAPHAHPPHVPRFITFLALRN